MYTELMPVSPLCTEVYLQKERKCYFAARGLVIEPQTNLILLHPIDKEVFVKIIGSMMDECEMTRSSADE